MSKRHIYFPSDLLKKGKSQKDGWYILGYRYECVYIVIQLVSEEYNTCNPPLGVLHGIEVIGTLNKQESKDQWLSLRLEDSKYPVLENYTRNDGGGITIIIFQPPNFKNLEYLSIKPILLQSGNEQNSVEPAVEIMNDKFKQIATPTINNDIHAFNTEILDKINQCYKLRTAYAKWTSKNGHSQFLKSDVLQMLRMLLYQFIFRPLTVIVCVLQTISIWLIKLLNIEYFKDNDGIGHKLTTYSAVLRQLELRLQQINYFPIQFLCYFDRTILYNESYPTGNFSNVGDTEFALVLNLPIFNSNLNINNSNYINFYNSVWLIINDVLVGITIQKLIVAHYNDIAKFINEVAIKKILFDDLYNLISWVSFRHPAGFKLNNELGLFVGDLFLWTLRFWKILCVDIFTISETGGSDIGGWYIGGGSVGEILSQAGFTGGLNGFRVFSGLLFGGAGQNPLFKTFISILCYIGYTFLISFLIDYLQIISFHIYCFYYTSANIYKKQIQILKSLFQLFCGKKYNVLRNRIDNLDNYSAALDLYEVDQLLLGTLFFVVLILLLPTIFAFYLMFFLTRIFCLLLINIAENLLVLINFFPIFVMLLKLKNSKRLQGGITFKFLVTTNRNTVYLQLSNKSLTYKEIFKNFVELFKNSKTFRLVSIIPNFLNGDPIRLVQQTEMKLRYLMLPRNYDQTVNVMHHFITANSQK